MNLLNQPTLKLRKLESIDSQKRQPYEVHVTIKSIEDTKPFVDLCESWTDDSTQIDTTRYGLENSQVQSCKAIIILLPEGVHTQQPMCSMFINGNLDQAIKWGELFGEYCNKAHGYTMIRNKVEARFRNVPDATPTVRGQPIYENEAIYWEFHMKLKFNVKDTKEETE